jgi:hypothetical protein
MKLTIELDQEIDGRWIAEIPELNVLLYGIRSRMRFVALSRPRGRLCSTGSRTANCLPILQTQCSTLQREFLALG